MRQNADMTYVAVTMSSGTTFSVQVPEPKDGADRVAHNTALAIRAAAFITSANIALQRGPRTLILAGGQIESVEIETAASLPPDAWQLRFVTSERDSRADDATTNPWAL